MSGIVRCPEIPAFTLDITKRLMDVKRTDAHDVVAAIMRADLPGITAGVEDFSVSRTNSNDFITEKTEYKGYVLGWNYYEGQTCTARNLLGLQHWASTMEFGVVEPFVRNSYLRADYFFSSGKSLRFSDYFNITEWNDQVVKMNYGKPLVTWEHFLEKASHQVIVVYIVIIQPNTSIYVDAAITNKCMLMSKGFTNKTLSPFNFSVVRQVCFEFNVHSPLSVDDFNRNIFGNFSKQDVSVVFTFVPGVFASRINLKETNLFHKFAGWLSPSERIVQHSKNYIKKFLGNGHYVAVVVRTEKLGATLVRRNHMSKERLVEFLRNCTTEISGLLSNFSALRFLALDLGRFGDPQARVYMTPATANHFIAGMVKIIYNVTWNSAQWEQSFVNATGGISDAGYIALVQKGIVTHATSIISAGSGSFLTTMKSNRAKLLGTKEGSIHSACKTH